MKSFQKLPPQFQCAEVKEYYDILLALCEAEET